MLSILNMEEKEMFRKKLKLLNDCKIPFLVMIVKHKRDIDGKFNVFNELPTKKLDDSPKTSVISILFQSKSTADVPLD